ncbi:MAG: ATP-dependent DNA ligase [Aeromicrobium sp.]
MLDFPQDPMLARHVTALPAAEALRGGCVYEPKFDGYRALLFVTDDGCRVQSRRGHDITDAFPDVATAAVEHLPAGLVLDGELVVWVDGGLDFGELQRRVGHGSNRRLRQAPASFVAFDLLAAAGTDIRSAALTVRRQLLEAVLEDAPPVVQLCPQTDDVEEAREWMDGYRTADVGIEGLVVKGRSTTYRNGAREWLKYRERDTVEVVVGAVSGSLEAPAHLLLGVPDGDGELHFAGTTSDLTARQRETVAPLLEAADGVHDWMPEADDMWRRGRSERRETIPVVASLVVEVSTDSTVQGGRWRNPMRFVRVRPDLTPDEVTVRDRS